MFSDGIEELSRILSAAVNLVMLCLLQRMLKMSFAAVICHEGRRKYCFTVFCIA